MSLQIYKPNAKNAGCACSFRFGTDMKTQEPVVFINAIQQHSWDENKKIGSFFISTSGAFCIFSIIFDRLLRSFFIILIGERLPKNTKKVNFIKKWFQKRRRIFHYLSYANQYELFILEPNKVDSAPIRTEEKEQGIDSKIDFLFMN